MLPAQVQRFIDAEIAANRTDFRGLPAHGNVTTYWDLGSSTHPDPEYR